VKILQVITDTDRRGAQVFATDLAAAMAARGHVVETVALSSGSQRPALDVQVLGTRQRGPATLAELRRRMARFDITIAHGSSTGLACAIAGIGRGRPFVYRQISDTRFWASSLSRRVRVALYLRQARSIVALSEGAKEDLIEHLRLPKDRITVVPNGVPVGNYHQPTDDERRAARSTYGLPHHGFIALYIGALVVEKGVDVAITAMSTLLDVTLVIAGGGPEELALAHLAQNLGVDVRFLGVASETYPLYAASDVVLLPSRGGDSMPATLIEAGLCGLPAVATPVGSIEEVVIHNQTGLIVTPGSADELASAVALLLGDEDLQSRMSAAARAHCLERFEIGIVAEGWLNVLTRTAGPTSH